MTPVPRAAAEAPGLSDEAALQQTKLARARWEEQEARLRLAAEAYRTAELAKACGDYETAGKLRACAAQWAVSDTSVLPASSLRGLASPDTAVLPAPATREVAVEIRPLKEMPGAREVSAFVDVAAPAEMVWRTLTDYERLAGA